MKRTWAAASWVLIATLLAGPAFAQKTKPGYLVVPALLDARDEKRHPGYVAPKVWVYDDVGTPLPNKDVQGAYAVGQKIPLDEGWYLIEVGNVQAKGNRAKLFVKAGKVTVVPSGLIVVNAEPHSAQPADVCNRWTGKLFISLPLDPKPGPLVATNQSAGHHSTGIVQVVAGYYRIQWNRFWIAAEVKANHALRVPTGLLGPMPYTDYRVHLAKGLKRDNPGLRLCRNRSTRLLARTYWGTYDRQISEYPFKQREWERITVERPKDKRGPYQKLGTPRIPGPIYKGPGSVPILMWEAEPPEPEKPEGKPDARPDPPSKNDDATGGSAPPELMPTPTP